jgi:hypothetical protein
MILKRTIIYSIFLALIVGVLPSRAFCQSDAYGIMDTVAVESKIVNPGGKLSVKVFLKNDEALSGISIPLKYPSDLIVYDSTSFANSRLKSWSTLHANNNMSESSLLFGGLVMNESWLPAGEGVIAEIFFHAAASAQSGLIDTAFFPPAGAFLLSSYESISIFPVFIAANLLVGANNQGPDFEPISSRLINEGETLSFSVTAQDPEGSVVHLYCGKLPPLAKFKDNGDGTGMFSWAVPYLGPGSASGSPFVVSFVATDGSIAVQMDVPIEVINSNRPPQISTTGSVTASSGDSVFIPLMASDLDLELVTFSATNLPLGAEIFPGNPGYITWGSSIADSGNYGIDVVAQDESGGVTHRQVALQLLATLPIELSLSNEQAFTNEAVTIPINLHNRVDVAGFRLLIEYDPTLLTPLSFTRDSIRTRSWYPFAAQSAGFGRLILNGRANPSIPGSNPLPPGEGAVGYLRFVTCPDPGLAGQFSRIEYKILDSLNNTENIIYLPDGTILPRSQVSLTSGSVLIKKYDALVGDLNLNLIPMEIGDAVYFTNYFLNPTVYPLSGVRWVNSDINQDGAPGTIGDLVHLLRIIVGDAPKINIMEGSASAESELEITDDGLIYKLTSSSEVGGALLTFRITGDDPVNCAALSKLANMELHSARDGNLLRVLILSSKGSTFTATGDGLFHLTTGSAAELVSQEIVDAIGSPIALTSAVSGGTLPIEFALEQNCPNPFNPETVISFSLEKTADVSLEIFNCLGQKVRVLFAGNQPTGKHIVRFDGTDDTGAQLASGVYLYRLRVGDQQLARKMVLLK